MAEPAARVPAELQQAVSPRRLESGQVVEQDGTSVAYLLQRSAPAGAPASPAGPGLLRLQRQAGNRAVSRLPGVSMPGLVQRRIRIGPPPKNEFAKRKAILGKLLQTQLARGPAIQRLALEILGEGGVEETPELRDFFRDLRPILETAADLFSRDGYDMPFASWDAAIDSSLKMILPIATTRGLLSRVTASFEQAKSTAPVTDAPGLNLATQRFDEAMALVKRDNLNFAEWTRALAWAQVQVNELRHANRPKPQQPKADDWQQKTTKSAKLQEVRKEVSIAERVQAIDAYTGDPDKIAIQFNQFVNAMEAQSVPTVPVLVHKYRTSGDRKKNQFSVEVRIPLLDRWVMHAHCVDATGETADGKNAMHYKRLADRYALGASIALTSRQENMLLPPPGERLAFRLD